MAKACLLLVFLCFCLLHNFVFANEKRILTDDPDMVETRFRQLELKIQSLTSKLAQQDNQMIQMQNTMHGLAHRLTEKDNEVSTLQAKLSEKDNQVANITARLGVLQTTGQTGIVNGKPYNGQNIGAESVTVTFNPPFERVPKVMWGASSYDYAEDHNLRFDSSISKITTNGFTLTFGDRGDTILYYVIMNWIACPDFI